MRIPFRSVLARSLAVLVAMVVLIALVAVLPLDGPATLALAQGDTAAAAGEEPVDVRTLYELLTGVYAAPAAAGAFVVALLGFIRARYRQPTGLLAVLTAAALSLAIGVAGVLTGALDGTITNTAIPFAIQTFVAAIAGREVLVNTARATGDARG